MTGISQKMCFRMRKEISEKINRMPLDYFESRTVGEVLSRITNDVDTPVSYTHLHTESLCNFNDFAADMSGADNTQCLSVDFHMVYLHAFGKVRMVIPGQHGHLPAHGGTAVSYTHLESGMGSAPITAAAARTKNPVRQALVASTGTFWDTVVVCGITGLSLIHI